MMTARSSILALSALAVVSSARAASPGGILGFDIPQGATLEAIVVRSGLEDAPLISPDAAVARRRIEKWPGNVSVVPASDYEDGAVLGLGDALARTPGVFVQGASGQESVKLSIRGSGLASPLGLRGVRLLRDGLPLSRIDDVADPSYADPFNTDYIEVYRGANALRYGAATLGGAINLVSPTGYSRPGLETRFEAGSNGHVRGQARAGRVFDNGIDIFAAISGYRTDGSSDHAEQSNSRFYGNLGFRFSPDSEGRLHLTIERHSQEIANPVTRAQLLGRADADQPPPTWPDRNVDTSPRTHLAYQHTLRFGAGDRIDFGLFYTTQKLDISGSTVALHYDAADYGVSVRGEISRSLAGRQNRFAWGASLGYGTSANTSSGPFLFLGQVVDPAPYQYEDIHGTRNAAEFFIENSYSLTPGLTLVAGAQAAVARRSVRIDALRNPAHFPVPVFGNVDHSARYTGISPKLGLLWQLAPKFQAFANVSRIFEPPTSLEFYNARDVLKAQRAVTVEVGTRGGDKAFRWEAAVYHSRVKNELLNIEVPPGSGRYASGNIDATRHAGVELSLGGAWTAGSMPGSFDWNIAYSWNRFRFTNDPVFGDNTLPGIPAHFGRLDAVYRHPSGLYLGPSLEFASSRQVDQANTLQAPGYGILNFTVGYAHPGGKYRLFLDARNLADKRYAASTEYVVNARGADMQAFNLGIQRSLFAGAQILW